LIKLHKNYTATLIKFGMALELYVSEREKIL
jgi:hypothetical protein